MTSPTPDMIRQSKNLNFSPPLKISRKPPSFLLKELLTLKKNFLKRGDPRVQSNLELVTHTLASVETQIK